MGFVAATAGAQDKNVPMAIPDAELLAKAKAARDSKRLFEPAGDNAIEYDLTLRARHPGDAAVKADLTDLFRYAMLAAEQNLQHAASSADPLVAQDYRHEASRLYGLLVRIDPNAPSLPRLHQAMRDEASSELKLQLLAATKAQACDDDKKASTRAAVPVEPPIETGSVQSAATGSPAAMVRLFYGLKVVTDEGGSLDAGDDPTVRRLLSHRLHKRFLTTIRYAKDWDRRHPCNTGPYVLKPPFVDGGFFSGSYDAVSGFRVLSAKPKGPDRWQVDVDVLLEADYHFENTVVVVREDGRFVIDDILTDISNPDPQQRGSLYAALKP
jgi:hypothetical protein